MRAVIGDDAGRVLPIVVTATPTDAASLRVQLPGGVWLHLPEHADPMRVSTLVRALLGC